MGVEERTKECARRECGIVLFEDKQKGEAEADRALIASAIDVGDHFNLCRLPMCTWTGIRERVCVHTLLYKLFNGLEPGSGT